MCATTSKESSGRIFGERVEVGRSSSSSSREFLVFPRLETDSGSNVETTSGSQEGTEQSAEGV